jgi:hypothetical protein
MNPRPSSKEEKEKCESSKLVHVVIRPLVEPANVDHKDAESKNSKE